jgi:predicted amidohydrolase
MESVAMCARVWCALLIPATAAVAAGVPRNRVVRVVTVSQADLVRTGPELLDQTMERLERAASSRPDIACLPEIMVEGPPEEVPGAVTRRVGEWARRYSSYAIFGILAKVGERVYNSAVLLDRRGQVVGRYDKINPTENELKKGIHPGAADPPVFATDFGLIGIQICFDVNWWETWKILKEKGARIIFFPAAYPAAKQLATIAMTNQFFVVSSSRSRLSRIYDITGDVLAVSGQFQPYAAAAIPIGKRLFEIDFHTHLARAIQKKYGTRVEVAWHHEDDWFTLASLDPDLTVEDLIREYGLTPLDDYRLRARKSIDDARSR